MRTVKAIASLGLLLVCGCGHPHASSLGLVAAAGDLAADPATNSGVGMVGTWHSRQDAILMELAPHELWKWWDLNF